MKKAAVVVLALTFAIMVAGCASLPVESKLYKTVSLTSMKGTNIRPFESSQRAIWLLWGLIPLSVPDVDTIIGPHATERTGVQNLKVVSKNTIVDGLITTLSFNIITVRTVDVSGEVYDLEVRSSGKTSD